jgi:hypothetical protein
MEVLMDRISYPLKLAPEDDLLIKKWKWRLAVVYGAILLMLILIVAAAPYTKTDVAKAAKLLSPLPRFRTDFPSHDRWNGDPGP